LNSAETLLNLDRCARLGFWGQSWEAPAIHPNEVLRRAVDAGLLTEESDPGQLAGDTVMTLASERTLDVEGSQYQCALHHAALADIIVTALRGNGERWARPTDLVTKGLTWVSSAFLAPSGVRLRRVLLADRWSNERFQSEVHSWKGLGEVAAYGMPLTMTVVLIGQRRDGRHHTPFSKGWAHPRSRTLRIRKRAGEFKENWHEVWRETSDFNRDHWLDQMRQDYVLNDVLFEKEISVPDQAVLSKVAHLAEKKLRALQQTQETPDPNPSVCFWPVPCQFRKCCWEFTVPSERAGFIPINGLVLQPAQHRT